MGTLVMAPQWQSPQDHRERIEALRECFGEVFSIGEERRIWWAITLALDAFGQEGLAGDVRAALRSESV